MLQFVVTVQWLSSFIFLPQCLYALQIFPLSPPLFSADDLRVFPVYSMWASRCMSGQTSIAFVHSFRCSIQVSCFDISFCESYLILMFFFPTLPLSVRLSRVAMLLTFARNIVHNVCILLPEWCLSVGYQISHSIFRLIRYSKTVFSGNSVELASRIKQLQQTGALAASPLFLLQNVM